MGSSVSMVRRTYVVGRSNKNASNLYRVYNCYDHLKPNYVPKISSDTMDIRLTIAIEAFNAVVSQKLGLRHKSILRAEEIELFKNTVLPEKILYRKLSSGPEAKDFYVDVVESERQIYYCKQNITELNEHIGRLVGISVFQMCCNYLRYLPNTIGQLTNLKMLIVARNRLVELPEEIALCKELREIDVSSNLLKSLPRSIAGLKRLNTLNISNNLFHVLPSFLGKLSSLKNLNVSSNPIKSLPLEIFKLPFLLSLSADSCPFEFKCFFEEKGEQSMLETVARAIIRNNLKVRTHMPQNLRGYLTSVRECSFCGGPYFENYVEVRDKETFDGEAYPVCYRMCSWHYRKHSARVSSLFEKNIVTHPTGLIQADMPSVTELFEPLCFNTVQLNLMASIAGKDEELCPLISLAKYNAGARKRFRIETLLDEDIENLNVFDAQ